MRFMTLLMVLLSIVPISNAQQYIIKLKPYASVADFTAFDPHVLAPVLSSQKRSDMVMSTEQQSAYNVVSGYITITIQNDDQLRALSLDSRVELIYKNRIVKLHQTGITNDSLSADQYALSRVGAKAAWQAATGKGVVIGVLDTGIDWEHEDLTDQLAIRSGEDLNANGRFDPWDYRVPVNGVLGDLDEVDNDGNGYVDDVIGYDFVDQSIRNIGDDRDRDAIPFDEQGHGTSVSGVIAAKANNTSGIAGLAYDARIAVLRAFDATGNAEEDDIASALIYAALNRIPIVNMSFGDAVSSPLMRDAVRFASAQGCVLVASSGNSGGTSRQFPASFDGVVAVGATNYADERAAFSSTGSILSMSAPGEAIVTTRAGGGYRFVNGTSFSAPHVSAAAALLIEQRGLLNPLSVKSMLMESSTDLGNRGWDGDFGAGRLQVDNLLNLPSESMVDITSPLNESEFDKSLNASLDVVGSTQASLFDSYSITIGTGIEPSSWTSVYNSDTAKLRTLLATIPSDMLNVGNNVVRLSVLLKDGRSIEIRKRIQVVVANTLVINDITAERAWRDDRRIVVLTLTTSRPTLLEAIVTAVGVAEPDTVTDVNRFTRRHSIAINPPLPGTRGTIRVRCTADNADVILEDVSFDLDTIAAPTTDFVVQSTAPFAGYVLNDVRSIYGNDDETFIMNDISNGNFDAMLSVQLDGISWGYVDSTDRVLIPRAMADVNGNGIINVLGQVVGETVLYEAETQGGNPFAKIIYQEKSTGYNGVELHDIDGDGLDELLLIGNNGVKAMKFKNGSFEQIGFASNPTLPSEGEFENSIDEVSIGAGDFDGDGNVEIAFSDTDGDLIISEYSNGAFATEYVFDGAGEGGSGYVASSDVDGDGITDIVFGVPDSVQPNVQGEYGRQAWTYRLFRFTGPDTYEIVWSDLFYGVRYGIGYRNGLGTGQLDMKGGEEIIICAFPRLYVFGWKNNGIVPMYYRADVASPRFLTYDFDHDGVNELGFGKTEPELGYMTAFQFVKYDVDEKRLQTPSGLRAVSTDSSSALLSWMPVARATAYRVFISAPGGGLFKVIDTVSTASYIVDTLNTFTNYSFRVSAMTLDRSIPESFRSAIVTINAGKQTEPVDVNPRIVPRSYFSKGIQLSVRFSEPMSEHSIEPTNFIILDNNNVVAGVGISSTLAGDSTVVISFGPLNISGDFFTLFVGKLYGDRTIPTTPDQFRIGIYNDSISTELTLAKLVVINNATLSLTYSMHVDESALDIQNYVLKPNGSIRNIVSLDEKTVEIRLNSDPPLASLGNLYALTVNNVLSTSGIPITKGAGNTLAFVVTADELEDVFVFPHPVRISTDEFVNFGNLTREAEIEILDQRFLTVVRIKEIDGNGGAQWDLLDANGKPVPPGMYFYRVTGANVTGSTKESGLRKLMIER